jgi:hypothetical protein
LNYQVLGNGFVEITNFLPQELFEKVANSKYWEREFSRKVSRENKHNDKKHLNHIKTQYREVFDAYSRIADKDFLLECVEVLDDAYPELKNDNIAADLNIDLEGDRRSFLQSTKFSNRIFRLLSRLSRLRKNFFLDLDFGLSISSYLIPKHIDQVHKQFACVVYLSSAPVEGSNQGGFGYVDGNGKDVEVPLKKNRAILFRNHDFSVHYTLPFDKCENFERRIIYFSLADSFGKNIQRR